MPNLRRKSQRLPSLLYFLNTLSLSLSLFQLKHGVVLNVQNEMDAAIATLL